MLTNFHTMISDDEGWCWQFILSLLGPGREKWDSERKPVNSLSVSDDGDHFTEIQKPRGSSPSYTVLASPYDSDSEVNSITSRSVPSSQSRNEEASSSQARCSVRAPQSPEKDEVPGVEGKPSRFSKKSMVWKFFTEKNPTHAMCLLCNKSVAHSGATTNLQAHLAVSHEKLAFAKKRRNTTSESSGESTAGEESPSKMKKKLISRNKLPRIDEAFERQHSFAPGGPQSDKITNALIYLICKDKEPLSLAEKEGFQYFVKTVAPHYTPPSRRTLTKLIDHRYIPCKDSHRLTLQEAICYTLTCDNWTDCTFQSYLGITIHYLTQDLKLESSCLGVFPLDKNHTANYLTDCLNEMIADFGLVKSKITAITSDGAANIKAAVQNIVSSDRQIWCFAHFTSHLVPKILKGLDELSQLIDIVRQFVVPFKRSVVAADELKKLQMDDGKTEGTAKKFKLDCPTRWNSQFYMLERFLELEEYLPGVIRKCRKGMFPSLLTHNQIEILQEVVQLMRPVESVIREISGTQYATCSVIPSSRLFLV